MVLSLRVLYCKSLCSTLFLLFVCLHSRTPTHTLTHTHTSTLVLQLKQESSNDLKRITPYFCTEAETDETRMKRRNEKRGKMDFKQFVENCEHSQYRLENAITFTISHVITVAF